MKDLMSDIETLIRRKGAPMGVNELSKALGVPLSTMQKKLENSPFVKTPNRKWDLPENVQNAAFNSTSNDIGTVLKTQAATVNNVLEMLQSGMSTLTTMINAASFTPAVAGSVPNNTTKVDERIYKVIEHINGIPGLIKEHKDKINEEYQELLDNMDWLGVFINKGKEGFNRVFDDLSGHIMGDINEISDEVINILRDNQKDK